VAIDGGRLLRAAPMAEFTAETGILTVEVEDGRDALAAGLAGRGLRILAGSGPTDRTVRIALDGGSPFDIVRDTVADLGLPLVRLERGRHSLEDLFRDDVPDDATAAGPVPAVRT
jgi:ABC-2 type transport system ATP-binding protein